MWSLIRPITHRMHFEIWGWDQYLCCALWKPGPPQSQTLRRQVVLNQAYIWLAWEVLRCNDPDVHDSPTHAITYAHHLSRSYSWGTSHFTIWHWLVHPAGTSCCSSQAGRVLLSIWPIPLLYLGCAYVCVIFNHTLVAHIPAVFDPRITYEGLKLDFANDPLLLADLNKSKSHLHDYYNKHYATPPALCRDTDNTHAKPSSTSDFTSCYNSIVSDSIDELEEYFKIKCKKCNPLRWWRGQREDWLNLYCLACDILCIPGS